jgi:tight adherence protein B
MEIVFVALGAVVLCLLGFFVIDRRGKNDVDSPENPGDRKSGIKKKEQSSPGGLIDYSVYVMSPRERLLSISAAAILLLIIGYIFYKNLIIAIILALAALYFPKIRTQQLLNKRKEQLTVQFKQALYSLGSSLSAGRSVENAFRAVADDLKMLFSDPDTYIIREFDTINRRVENGEPIENALLDFSQRADIEDITNFVDVFVTCKRTGGNLAEIVRRTSGIIGDKIQTQQDISVMMAQKRFEAKALLIAPIAIVAVTAWSSPDYMAPLYRLGIGTVIMTGALLILAAVYWVIQKIMDIKV